MTRFALLRAVTAAWIAWLPFAAAGAVPQALDYQVYLTDAAGAPITDNVTVTVTLYAVPTGGTALWQQAYSVTPAQGLVSLALGSPPNSLPPGLFDTPVFAGVRVDGDTEMQPRRAFASTGYAFRAADADTLQGASAAALDQSTAVAALDTRVSSSESDLSTALAAIAVLQNGLAAAVADIAANQSTIATLEGDLAFAQADITTLQATLAGANATIAQLSSELDAAQATIAGLASNSVLALDGMLTLDGTTARFESVNVQVVNGGGTSAVVNGLGNLLVGYDEPDPGPVAFTCSLGAWENQPDCVANSGTWADQHKSGSHNLVVGGGHRYSRSSGIVSGASQTLNGDLGVVAGGSGNRASGLGATVTGGSANIASGDSASVSGGTGNTAFGIHASVSGGEGNVAFGTFASVLGGQLNVAGDPELADTGLGSASTVVGGFDNAASGLTSVVLGGSENLAEGADSSVAGGQGNVAAGAQSAVGGGKTRTAPDQHDWAAGSLLEDL